jgi:RNA-directed DNA polymerase
MRDRYRRYVADTLAGSFLAGTWTGQELAARGVLAFGGGGEWIRRVVRRVIERFPEPPLEGFRVLADVVQADEDVRRQCARGDAPRIVRTFIVPDATREPRLGVVSLPAARELAAWLDVDEPMLEWLADVRGLSRRAPDERLRHYVARWVPKRSGGARLLEIPKPRLRAIQRRLLCEILDRIPAHDAAHGFRAGRSALTHAAAHVGKHVVLRLDLEDFFPTVPYGRIAGVFKAVGYSGDVSRILAGLCTCHAPSGLSMPTSPSSSAAELQAAFRARRLYRARHLPQGAPTSPSLANLCVYAMDVRLAGAARAAGATYTRYADDLVFSGGSEFARRASRFEALAGAIVVESGFHVNYRKTRRMARGVRQEVTGLVVNDRVAIARDAFDQLKATLHNCATVGPESQNRGGHPSYRAHLAGAVAWVEHVQPPRGAKLRRIFDRIRWID